MKLWKRRQVASILYSFALGISLLLSVISYHFQTEIGDKLMEYYDKDLALNQWLQLEKTHQLKMNALTRGFLSKKDLWTKDYINSLKRYNLTAKDTKDAILFNNKESLYYLL